MYKENAHDVWKYTKCPKCRRKFDIFEGKQIFFFVLRNFFLAIFLKEILELIVISFFLSLLIELSFHAARVYNFARGNVINVFKTWKSVLHPLFSNETFIEIYSTFGDH